MATRVRESIQTTPQDKHQLTVVVCGMVQTGKSSLINSTTGGNLAKTTRSPQNQNHTEQCFEIPFLVSDTTRLNVRLWDTPGLGGVSGDQISAIRRIKDKIHDSGVLVYCIDIRGSLKQHDIATMIDFGPDVCKNAIFALTFANEVKPPPQSTKSAAEFFKILLSQWQVIIRRVLIEKLSIPEPTAEKVAIIPIGHQGTPPPDRDDWLTILWRAVFHKNKVSTQLKIDTNTMIITVHHSGSPRKHTRFYDTAMTVPDDATLVPQTVKIAITGLVQTGKSALINSITGGDHAKEARSPLSQTLQLQQFDTHIQVQDEQGHKIVNVKLTDTPGLARAFGEDKSSAKIAIEQARESDLLVYCIDMRTRLEEDDSLAMSQLTKEVGPDVWKKAIFALTFANEVKPPPHSLKDEIEHFEKLIAEWQSLIPRILCEKLSIQRETADKIPIIPAGYRRTPPPDHDEWITSFWQEALYKNKPSPLAMTICHPSYPPRHSSAAEFTKRLSTATDGAFQQKNNLTILVAGKVQTGKSALVNGIIGRSVAVENQSPLGETQEMAHYEVQVQATNGKAHKTIKIVVHDTPGLGNTFGDQQSTLRAIADLFDKADPPDLLVYCVDMRTRLELDDINGMKELTSSICANLWRNAVIALTFANDTKPPPRSTEGRVEYFKRLLTGWQTVARETLKSKVAIPEDIADNVVVIPTGYSNASPPDRDDWITPFWQDIFRNSKDSARLDINIDAMTISRVQEPLSSPPARRHRKCVVS